MGAGDKGWIAMMGGDVLEYGWEMGIEDTDIIPDIL